jgi:lipopolysaccharide export system protein LptA
MIKTLFLGLLLVSLSGSRLLAQTISGGTLFSAKPALSDSTPSSNPAAKKPANADQAPPAPTVIDSAAMDYDEKSGQAIFTGENYGVFVKDPKFTLYCDKLTAFMRKGGPAAGAPKGKPSPAPSPAKKPVGDPAASKAGGLQRALAEGVPNRPVVIVQDKPASEGEQAQHNVGIAEKADYNAETGDIILTGWPQVSQGVNTQVATSPKTVMIMNKDGGTMRTNGPSRSTIQEQKEEPKKSGTNSK